VKKKTKHKNNFRRGVNFRSRRKIAATRYNFLGSFLTFLRAVARRNYQGRSPLDPFDRRQRERESFVCDVRRTSEARKRIVDYSRSERYDASLPVLDRNRLFFSVENIALLKYQVSFRLHSFRSLSALVFK